MATVEAAAPVVEAAAPSNAYLDKVKDTAANVSEQVKNFTATNYGTVVAIVLLGIVITLVTALGLYYLIYMSILDQKSYLLPETKTPIVATQITNIKGDAIPNNTNGRRASVCFWMYIHDLNKFSGSYRHVFHRGEADSSWETSGPYVRMDKDTNKVSITWGSPSPYGLSAYSTYTPDEKWEAYKYGHGITFDYIPLQRWVHVCAVVNEDTNGGIITGYIDGEVVKIVSSSKPPTTKPSKPTNAPSMQIDKLNLNTKGNVYVGGSISESMGPGFSGMVSKIEFFNFEMNAKDVYANYLKGPIDNLLAKLGLPAYGLQSPVYRIGK
jgi:hypothetical protein